MVVGDDDLVSALIIRFGLPDAECDGVCFTISVDLVAATLHDLSDAALKELDLELWSALNNQVDVAIRVCWWRSGRSAHEEGVTRVGGPKVYLTDVDGTLHTRTWRTYSVYKGDKSCEGMQGLSNKQSRMNICKGMESLHIIRMNGR